MKGWQEQMIVGRKTEDVAHICILLLHDGCLPDLKQSVSFVIGTPSRSGRCIKVHAVRYGFDDPVRAS